MTKEEVNKQFDDDFYVFISDNCECHFVEHYGFVLETDCKEHNTSAFIKFIKNVKSQFLIDILKKEL